MPHETFGPAEPPESSDLHEVGAASKSCRACPLWRDATQTVFGEGNERPRLVLVGEQPGDQEDKQGHPFVGPAGRVLDTALASAGIDPRTIYTTNAVKHFKWEARGTRRLHKRPTYREVRACYPWLEKEIEILQPELVVCLGSTAAQSLFGRDIKVTLERGKFRLGPLGRTYMITVHPSSILRARSEADRHSQLERFLSELKCAADFLASPVASRISLR